MSNETNLIEWNGATLTVAPATIRSEITKDRIMIALLDGGAEQITAYRFAQCASQTAVDGDLDWQPPALTADSIQESFEAWLDLPGKLYRLWINAVDAVNAPTAPDELQAGFDAESADPEA